MSILSGWIKTAKYKLTADGYKKQSLDTSSETVYMNDGNTAETNLGAIQGITDSLTATNSNVALSANAGKNLQDQITTVNSNLTNLDSKLDGKSSGLFVFPVTSYVSGSDKNNTIIATFSPYMMKKYNITCTGVDIIGAGGKWITSQETRANGLEILCRDVADFGGHYARCTFKFSAK